MDLQLGFIKAICVFVPNLKQPGTFSHDFYIRKSKNFQFSTFSLQHKLELFLNGINSEPNPCNIQWVQSICCEIRPFLHAVKLYHKLAYITLETYVFGSVTLTHILTCLFYVGHVCGLVPPKTLWEKTISNAIQKTKFLPQRYFTTESIHHQSPLDLISSL